MFEAMDNAQLARRYSDVTQWLVCAILLGE